MTIVSRCLGLAATSYALLTIQAAAAQDTTIKLDVDATDAPRKVLHAHLQIPVQPGKLTLVYPKWIPGDHSPQAPSPT